nr:MAG TPA: hypothetical protein [Caudoviricetes sp.]
MHCVLFLTLYAVNNFVDILLHIVYNQSFIVLETLYIVVYNIIIEKYI